MDRNPVAEEPTSANGWLMKIGRKSGKISGYMESAHGHHVLNVAARGELLSGARPDTVPGSGIRGGIDRPPSIPPNSSPPDVVAPERSFFGF
jgi:hypothetical protein